MDVSARCPTSPRCSTAGSRSLGYARLAPALEMLDLSGGELTDRGAALLIAARGRFERLRAILVEDCRPLSDASRARLRELYEPRRSAARRRSSSA